MARRGFGGTALRAALGAVTGVAEGMRLREEREFEREKEKAAAARQAMYDALALSDRGALPTAQSRALGQRAAGETVKAFSGAINALQGGAATPFDESAIAQGAGRMGAPTAKFTVGGVEYALPDQEQRRRALEAQSLATELAKRESFSRIDQEAKIRADQREIQRVKELAAAAKKGGRQSEAAIELAVVSPQAYNAIYPEPTRGADRSMTEYQRMTAEQKMDAAEARWNSLVNTPVNQLTPEEQQFRSTMVRTFDRLRNRDPRTGAVRGKTEPARSLILQAVSAAEEQEALRRQNRPKNDLGYLGIGAGMIPSASQTLGQPVGAAAPAAPTEEQALWDQAVAQYGRDRVLKEYGPRP